MKLSLHHLTHFPASPSLEADSVYPTILALHGRGSNESDLIGLAPYLPQNFLWISPRGTFTLGPDSFEWFQITQIGKPDPTRLANALSTLDTFIDEVIEIIRLIKTNSTYWASVRAASCPCPTH